LSSIVVVFAVLIVATLQQFVGNVYCGGLCNITAIPFGGPLNVCFTAPNPCNPTQNATLMFTDVPGNSISEFIYGDPGCTILYANFSNIPCDGSCVTLVPGSISVQFSVCGTAAPTTEATTAAPTTEATTPAPTTGASSLALPLALVSALGLLLF